MSGQSETTVNVAGPGVSFYTLGCKLNQLETESVAAAFAGAGFTVMAWSLSGKAAGEKPLDKAALLVINTCTVTSKAEQKARRLIRLALRESSAPLIVTGCYARLEAEKLAALETESGTNSRLFVVSAKDSLLDLPSFLADWAENSGVSRMADGIRSWLRAKGAVEKSAAENRATDRADGAFRFNPDVFSFHSRAFLKIQDGCNRHCAYCRVPLARGESRSLDSAEVLARLRALEGKKYAETVITGVNIAQYRCPATGRNLGELLRFLLDNTVSVALRLSSIEVEPGFLDKPFLEALSRDRLRPHFHLSVQSGSASVLKAMGRPYGPDGIRETAAALRSVKNDPFLGCDIIAGFPGESAADFEETRELCAAIDFAWIHGFPYSPRPGTAAWSLKNRPGEGESARRLAQLLELSQNGREAYVRRWTGKTVDAVVEAKKLPFLGVLTDNYLRIRAAGEAPGGLVPGTAVSCRIMRPLRPNSGSFDALGEILVY